MDIRIRLDIQLSPSLHFDTVEQQDACADDIDCLPGRDLFQSVES